MLLANFLLITAVVAVAFAFSGPHRLAATALAFIAFLVASVTYFPSSTLRRLGFMLLSQKAHTTRSRPSILYLRSFTSDKEFFGAGGLTSEYEVTRILHRIGPVISFGRPREATMGIGGLRKYATNDQWQQAVVDELKKCRFVIIEIGTSEGLRWEVQQVVESVPPDRILLFVPHRVDVRLLGRKKNASYDRFRERFSSLIPSLPACMKGAEFIRFDEGARPYLLSTHGVSWWTRMRCIFRGDDVPRYLEMLRPLFVETDTRRMRVFASISEVIVIVLALWLILKYVAGAWLVPTPC